MKRFAYSICLLLILIPFSTFAADDRIKIVWFANLDKKTTMESSPFWMLNKALVQEAANDLKIQLKIIYFDGNQFDLIHSAKTIMKDKTTRPDAILFHNFKFTGSKLLQIAEQYQVKSFVFNSGFPPKDHVGIPRERYKHWIGQIFPNDHETGYLLAKTLFKEAKKLPKYENHSTLKGIGFTGTKFSQASLLRAKGLQEFDNKTDAFELYNTIYTNWTKAKAKSISIKAIDRYKELSIFWAASDTLAKGIIDAASSKGMVSGKDYVVGGVDGLPSIQPLVENGQLTVSVGGHYADIVTALIMTHDYLKGIDFADTEGTTIYSKMFALTRSNSASFGNLRKKLSSEHLRQIDFSKYSKWYNQDLKKYDFSIQKILQE